MGIPGRGPAGRFIENRRRRLRGYGEPDPDVLSGKRSEKDLEKA